jgi:GTP diphosphokinase / guanosine-3',5'-bis(diphosphate) 3'-diphosphatase
MSLTKSPPLKRRRYIRKLEYTAEHESTIKAAYKQLLVLLNYQSLDEDQRDLIRQAFELAADSHIKQVRKTGGPYILHPIAVAEICIKEMKLDLTSAVVALLHDVVEDTEVTLPEIESYFGKEIAIMVDGLTKLDHSQLKDMTLEEAENLGDDPNLTDKERLNRRNMVKIVESMFVDIRILFIKFADRMHNLRTIDAQKPEKQFSIADETEMLYTPLAHRLGLNNVKSEFEDICLRIKNPEAYANVENFLNSTRAERESYVERFKQPLIKPLEDNLHLKFRIDGRAKSISSIHEKLSKKNLAIEELHDVFAIRIIIDSENQRQDKSVCYLAYTIITDIYQALSGRMKDYITHPKNNGYMSLHDVMMGPDSRMVEVQIRTKRMDTIADHGTAAHFRYKGKAGVAIDWQDEIISNLLNKIKASRETSTSFDQMLGEIYKRDIMVYTPKGDRKILPEGATALDFAFAIHTDVGSRCKMCLVDGELVPFSHKLSNGQVVRIKTDPNQRPNSEWLEMVTTSRASSKIRLALRQTKLADSEFGKEKLFRKFRSLKANENMENVDFLLKYYHYKQINDLYNDIYANVLSLEDFGKFFKVDKGLLVDKTGKVEKNTTTKPVPKSKIEELSIKDFKISIDGANVLFPAETAVCCNAKPRVPIFAYQAIGRGYRIHRKDCPNARELYHQQGRTFEAEWVDSKDRPFEIELDILGVDHGKGVTAGLTGFMFSDLGLSLASFNIMEVKDSVGYFTCLTRIRIESNEQFEITMRRLRMFPGVVKIERTA